MLEKNCTSDAKHEASGSLGGPCHLNLIDKANLKDDKSLIGAENEVTLETSI